MKEFTITEDFPKSEIEFVLRLSKYIKKPLTLENLGLAIKEELGK